MIYDIEFEKTINGTYILTCLHWINGYRFELNKSLILALIANDKDIIEESIDLLEDKLNSYSIINEDSKLGFYNREEVEDFIKWLNSRIMMKKLSLK